MQLIIISFNSNWLLKTMSVLFFILCGVIAFLIIFLIWSQFHYATIKNDISKGYAFAYVANPSDVEGHLGSQKTFLAFTRQLPNKTQTD